VTGLESRRRVSGTVGRSIGALLAGAAVGIALSLGTDLHAMIGGLLGLIVSTLGAVASWNRGPAFGPHWYPVALIITALPTAWIGAKLRLAQLRQPADA
jgi:hypothetical protein